MLREEVHLTIEARIKDRSPQERLQQVSDLLERGRQYLPQYEQALARGEVIEAAAGEDEEGVSGAPRPRGARNEK